MNLNSAQKFFPALASFASFCYSQHRELFLNATHIQSQSGVQQRLFGWQNMEIIVERNDKCELLSTTQLITGYEETANQDPKSKDQ